LRLGAFFILDAELAGVGARLPAMAVGLSHQCRLIHRHRGQARSYRGCMLPGDLAYNARGPDQESKQ